MGLSQSRAVPQLLLHVDVVVAVKRFFRVPDLLVNIFNYAADITLTTNGVDTRVQFESTPRMQYLDVGDSIKITANRIISVERVEDTTRYVKDGVAVASAAEIDDIQVYYSNSKTPYVLSLFRRTDTRRARFVDYDNRSFRMTNPLPAQITIDCGSAYEHTLVHGWAMGVVLTTIMAAAQEDQSIVGPQTTCTATLSIGERSMVLENIGLPIAAHDAPSSASAPGRYEPPAYDAD